MQKTSLEAHDSIKDIKPTRYFQICDALAIHGPMTNLELSKFLGLPINSITGRVNELVNQHNILEEKGLKLQDTGRKAIKWGLK